MRSRVKTHDISGQSSQALGRNWESLAEPALCPLCHQGWHMPGLGTSSNIPGFRSAPRLDLQKDTRCLTPKFPVFQYTGWSGVLREHWIQDEWALWKLLHTHPEVIETGWQEEKEEALLPGAGSVSAQEVSLGTFPSFLQVKAVCVCLTTPPKKRKTDTSFLSRISWILGVHLENSLSTSQ